MHVNLFNLLVLVNTNQFVSFQREAVIFWIDVVQHILPLELNVVIWDIPVLKPGDN